jgi:hypothetical protein
MSKRRIPSLGGSSDDQRFDPCRLARQVKQFGG